MTARPRIAIMLDENTSTGSTRYEAGKSYFLAIDQAGGNPYGIGFLANLVDEVVREFDGLMCIGGRFAYPDEWYTAGSQSHAPASDRFLIERALAERFLAADKPVLGICAGMQLLACLAGCRLCPDITALPQATLAHDGDDARHSVTVAAGTLLHRLTAASAFTVNSLHREAVTEIADNVVVSARADDGIVEAIELRDKSFAVGVQWHQERFVGQSHPGNGIFQGFVTACHS